MKKPTATTSLWDIVETLQHALETQGLEGPAVDAAVTRRIASMLRGLARSAATEARREAWSRRYRRHLALQLYMAGPAEA